MQTLVFQYGLLPPTDNAYLVRQQLRLGHDYRNAQTERCIHHRAALRELLRKRGGKTLAKLEREAAAALAELSSRLKEVKRQRAKTRSRSESDIARQAVTNARRRLREARSKLSRGRAKVRRSPAYQRDREKLDAAGKVAEKRVRADYQLRGSFWGTRQLGDMAVDAAGKTSLYDGLDDSDPKFRSWRGEGRVGVQIQHGISAADLFRGDDTRLRIDPVDEMAWWSTVRSERRRLSRTRLHIRIGSAGKAPIWAVFPMIMHRPLPDGALVMRAAVSLRRSGPRELWSVELTVRVADAHVAEPCGRGIVAIDLGWRVMADGIRVARYYADDGASGEIQLDERLVSSLRYHEKLQKIRDDNLNAMREELVSWLKKRTLPDWLQPEAKHLGQWRAPARFAALARRWADNRFRYDRKGYELLESWRYHDHHLWQWERDQCGKSRRRRRELYRCCGAQLARQYDTVVFEDLDLSQLARRARTEDEAENESARSNRQLVSTHQLRDCIVNAFRRRGGTVGLVEPAYTTKDCHACGSEQTWDQAAELVHRCTDCGALWDQDDNAAKNLLERYCESPKGTKRPQSARSATSSDGPTETKWQRVARLKNEKAARKRKRSKGAA